MTPEEKLRAAAMLWRVAESFPYGSFYDKDDIAEFQQEIRDLAAKLEAEANG